MINKILIIYRVNIDNLSNNGIKKKLLGTVNVLNSHYTCSYLALTDNAIILDGQSVAKIPIICQKGFLRHIYHLYFYYLKLNKLQILRNYDLIYWRFHLINSSWIRILKSLPSDIVNILEFPTYPYLHEYKQLYQKIFIYYNQKKIKSFHKYFKGSVLFTAQEPSWPIPSYFITNGIEVNKIPLTKSILEQQEIILLAVGKWNFWHGLDRLLQGIVKFSLVNQTHTVRLKIVGSGPAMKDLKSFVEANSLQKYVDFLGPLVGEALDKVYENVSVCIGSLGIHRLGIYQASPLKHREYCARGIPFLLSTKDPDFPENKINFVKYFEQNDSAIEIEKILHFINCLKKDNNLKRNMRDYAEVNLDYKQKILDLFNNFNVTRS